MSIFKKGFFYENEYIRARSDRNFSNGFLEDYDGTWDEIEWISIMEGDVIRVIRQNNKHYTLIGISKKDGARLIRFKLTIEEIDAAFSRCFKGLGCDKKQTEFVKKVRKTGVPKQACMTWS